ncbi:MAG: cytochrome C, partial [Rhodospirillaceae bacterium]|nr:cytochrome C [Rhodospirillaceae bacterium]
SGWRAVDVPADYAAECGDCHDAYHPSLRTGTAWRAIIDGLENHYGEDASLDVETTALIRAYLAENHAGTFDTEVAHSVGRIETPSFRMTDTVYWKKRHREIGPSVFRLKAIGSKVNCHACHKDAASGRFDDVKIHLPSGDKS